MKRTFAGSNLTDPLGTGASRTLFNGFNTSNLSVGQHTLWVGADNFGQTSESDETNNWRSITFTVTAPPQADLAVSNLGLGAASVVQGQNLGFVYTVVNNGPGQSNLGYGGFYIDGTDTAHYGGNNLTDPLGWGASRTLFNGFNTSNLSVGQHTLWVGADNFGQTAESNETNNWRSITFTVTGSPQADLDVTSLAVGSASVAQGQKSRLRLYRREQWPGAVQPAMRLLHRRQRCGALRGQQPHRPVGLGGVRTLFNGFNTSNLSVGQHTLWVGADNWPDAVRERRDQQLAVDHLHRDGAAAGRPRGEQPWSGCCLRGAGPEPRLLLYRREQWPGAVQPGYGGFYIDGWDEAHYGGNNLTDPLGWGASRTLFNGFNTSNLSVGQHTLWVGADNFGQTAESDETNNWQSMTFTVTGAAGERFLAPSHYS